MVSACLRARQLELCRSGAGRAGQRVALAQRLLASHRASKVVARAEERSGSSTSSTTATAYLEAAVPKDQRPVNELAQLKGDLLYAWGSLDMNGYVQRLAGVFGFFLAVVGGPVAYQTFSPSEQPVEWILSASVGSLVVVAIVVVRIFLGWAYVSDRLLSATYAYEETGWYDGQTFVKPPEVLTRDRLLGMYETKPVLQKLRATLIGSGLLLLLTASLLYGLIKADTDSDGMYGRSSARGPRQVTADGIIFSSGVQNLSQLREDDELAAKEAAAQGGVPGYCRDRLLRAAAGGGVCSKFD